MQLVNPPSDPFDVFIAHDPVMRRIEQQLRRWAKNLDSALITGESGVGKSLAACVSHMASSAPQTAFVTCRVNEPDDVANRWATLLKHGATIVLDDLERWSAEAQEVMVQQLAQWPHEGPVLRVLGTSRPSLARLELEARIHPALGRRWGTRVVHIPPLRTRPDDLAPLVRVMLRRSGRPSVRLEPGAWRALRSYGWPDNIRELRRVLDATLAGTAAERIEAQYLVLDPLAPPALEFMGDQTFDTMRQAVDTWYLRRLLHQTDGNLSEAARRAGCSRKVLRDRLRRRGLYAPPVRTQPPGLSSAAREPAPAIGAVNWASGAREPSFRAGYLGRRSAA